MNQEMNAMNMKRGIHIPGKRHHCKRLLVLIMVIFAFMFLVTGSEGESDHFQITTDLCDQRFPAIYGDIIVWQDNRNGNWDIYGYDCTRQEEFQITTDPNHQKYPVIYGDIVFWLDGRYDHVTIHGYNLVTKKDVLLPSHPEPYGKPAFYGTIIVWEGSPGEGQQICGYDLATQQLFQLSPYSTDQRNPAIFEDMVVWEDWRDRYLTIYGYNFRTYEEIPIGSKGQFIRPHGHQTDPVIYTDVIIWLEGRGEDVYGYNLLTRERLTIAAASLDKCHSSSDWWTSTKRPAVYENSVIWVDCKNGNSDIYGYNLLTGQEFQVTSDKKCQQSPALYRNIVVWEDNRNGNWDIYGFDLSSPVAAVPNSRKILLLAKYVYIAMFAIPLIGALLGGGKTIWDVTSLNRPPEDTPWSQAQVKYFERDVFPLASLVIGMLAAIGIIISITLVKEWVATLFFISLALFWFVLFVWEKKVPYIRITAEKISIFYFFFRKDDIRWDTVQRINYSRSNGIIELILLNGMKFIYMSVLDEDGKKDIITALRNPPCAGIVFSYLDGVVGSMQ